MDEHNAINEDFIFSRVGEVMKKLNQNKQLQELAKSNGLEVTNTLQLTEETSNNVAVGVVSLLLAQQSSDPDYSELVRVGMSHRKLKSDLINKYKNQANQLIDKYKIQLRESAVAELT
jgi:hypothetical protein